MPDARGYSLPENQADDLGDREGRRKNTLWPPRNRLTEKKRGLSKSKGRVKCGSDSAPDCLEPHYAQGFFPVLTSFLQRAKVIIVSHSSALLAYNEKQIEFDWMEAAPGDCGQALFSGGFLLRLDISLVFPY